LGARRRTGGFSVGVIDEVKTWHAEQKPIPNVSEAICQLAAIDLKAKS
jgi:hypothetical protein